MITIATRAGGSDVSVGDDQAKSIPEPRPPAPVIDSFSPFFLNPSTALQFAFTAAAYDTFTQELYSDAGLMHLVYTRTDSFPLVQDTISGLTPSTQYWLRCKITLGGADSAWSSTATASTTS